MNTISKKDKIISTWWVAQGAVFTAIFIVAVCNQDKPPVWAVTFAIILCLAAFLRQKGEQLRRIADMVLLAYAVSFAIIAALLAGLNSFKIWFVTMIVTAALANIAASIASLWRKKTKR